MVVSSNPWRRNRPMAAARMRARVSSLLAFGFKLIQHLADGNSGRSPTGARRRWNPHGPLPVPSALAEAVEEIQIEEVHDPQHQQYHANLIADQFDGLPR